MEPTTTRQVKDLRPSNRVKIPVDHGAWKWFTISTVRPNLPQPDEGKTLLVVGLCRQFILSPDTEVIIDKAGMNIGAPMKDVRHADLQRVGDSQHTSECPSCGDGVLTMKRSPSSGKLQNSDFCTLCGQAFWYTDLPNDVLTNAGEMDVMKN